MNYERSYIETHKKEEKESNLEVGGNPDSVELYLSLASKRKKSDLGQVLIDTYTRTRTHIYIIDSPSPSLESYT